MTQHEFITLPCVGALCWVCASLDPTYQTLGRSRLELSRGDHDAADDLAGAQIVERARWCGRAAAARPGSAPPCRP